MTFSVRWINGRKYAEVKVELENGTLETGLLDVTEQSQLARNLRDVADELSPEEE